MGVVGVFTLGGGGLLGCMIELVFLSGDPVKIITI